jgi:tetratricopeptide (TPR) repeat protein
MLLEAMSYLIALYTETNRIEEAPRINRRMLDINLDDSDSHFSLGYIYRYAGMLQESIQAM